MRYLKQNNLRGNVLISINLHMPYLFISIPLHKCFHAILHFRSKHMPKANLKHFQETLNDNENKNNHIQEHNS